MPLFDLRSQQEKDADRWKSVAAAGVVGSMVPSMLYEHAVLKPELRKAPPADLLLDSRRLVVHPKRSGAFIRAGTTLADELTGADLESLRRLTNAGKKTVILSVPANANIPGTLYANSLDVDAINLPDVKSIRKDILAHEMVHSSMSNAGGVNKARRIFAQVPKVVPGAFGGIGSLLVDPESDAQAAGLLGAQALLEMPTLVEEAYANRGAYKAMRQLRAEGSIGEAALQAAKSNLLKSMGSYGVGALAGLLGTAGVIAARRGAFEE